MRRHLAVAALACAAWFAVVEVRAQQAPRDMWPQATAAARDGDFDGATKRTDELLATGRTYGLKTFPQYAGSAAGLASESAKTNAPLAAWSSLTAAKLDGNSPAVAFNEADRAARNAGWGKALPLAFSGFARGTADYRTRLLATADLTDVAALALALTLIVFAIAMFVRHGRSLAHDFREMLSRRMSGGSVSVLAFALLFLPIFLWLGPMWLVFYWLAVFFVYEGAIERIATIVLLVLATLLPIVVDVAASRVAGVESPVVLSAISSEKQAYQPEALRRLQELIAVVPDHPTLHLLLGNMLAFEGQDDQSAQHYRRAIELDSRAAGAHVNLGNLLFLNNEFQAALNEYQKAQKADPDLAIAYYNASVASGETYKFDQQAQMLDRARKADRSFVERVTRTPPPQKIVMYSPPIANAWDVTEEMAKTPAARALFGNYASFDVARTAVNPLSIGSIVALLLALVLWFMRRRSGVANSCIKCGRTFCHRCKSARESTTYCTQCIHIYLKRDGVSLDTKRKKLEEVTEHLAATTRRNRAFATFIPGSAQMMEGRTISGVIGTFLFALFVAIAVFVGRLAPAIGPSADVAQMVVRIAAIAAAVILWLTMSLPVYRRRSAL